MLLRRAFRASRAIRCSSSYASQRPRKLQTEEHGEVEVNEVGIPIKPIDTLKDFDAIVPRQFTRDELLHLHKLAAIAPPESESEWDELTNSLSELAGIIELVRTRAGQDGAEIDVNNPPDGRVRHDPIPYDRTPLPPLSETMPSKSLLELASTRQGKFYTAPTPAGIRTKPSTKISSGDE